MIYITATDAVEWFSGLMKDRVPIIHLQRNLWRSLYTPEEKGEYVLFLLGTCNQTPPIIPNAYSLGVETARIFQNKNGVIRIDHFEDFLGYNGLIANRELSKFITEIRRYTTDIILTSDIPTVVTSLMISSAR